MRDLTNNTEEVGVSDMETDRIKNGEEAVKMFGTEAWLAARDLGFQYLIGVKEVMVLRSVMKKKLRIAGNEISWREDVKGAGAGNVD